LEVADVDLDVDLAPGVVAEAALGNAADERHLAAFREGMRLLGAGAAPLPFVAARGGLAVAAADAAAHAFLESHPVNANVDGGQIHGRLPHFFSPAAGARLTPRSCSICSFVRSICRPAIVAFTRLMGFELPWTLVRML